MKSEIIYAALKHTITNELNKNFHKTYFLLRFFLISLLNVYMLILTFKHAYIAFTVRYWIREHSLHKCSLTKYYMIFTWSAGGGRCASIDCEPTSSNTLNKLRMKSYVVLLQPSGKRFLRSSFLIACNDSLRRWQHWVNKLEEMLVRLVDIGLSRSEQWL